MEMLNNTSNYQQELKSLMTEIFLFFPNDFLQTHVR